MKLNNPKNVSVLTNNKTRLFFTFMFLVTILVVEVNCQGQYVGSKNSDKYHYPSCYWAGKINPVNEVWFVNAQDAVNHNYIPCKVCGPPLPVEQKPEIPEEPEPPRQDILTVFVSEVIDGDTFDTAVGYRIRLADIDAPEYYETGYLEATEYLESLIEYKNVILNIDSDSGTDSYGRYVCLVFVEHNSTHNLNVNQALVEGGYATVSDYTNNEFNPNYWVLYSSTTTPTEPETPEEPEIPTEPETPEEPQQPVETPLITTEVDVILAVAIASIISVVVFWALKIRK